MPLTVNGFGTTYFGKKDVDEKGIYLTTLFITAFHMPVFPLASYWVMPYGTPIENALIREQKFEAVMIQINWQQVLSVYIKWYVSLVVAFFCLIFVVGVFMDYRDQSEGKPHRQSAFETEFSKSIVKYLLTLRSSGAPQKRGAP